MRTVNYLEDLKKEYQQKYGVAVFDIKTKNTESGAEIKGEVLTENQKNDIIDALEKRKIKVKKANVKVLSDTDERNEIGWAVVKKNIANIKSRFVSNKILNKKILARIRCSQALKGEILRVLYKYENQLLVQQNDLTLGWVDRNEIIEKKKSLYKEWKWIWGNYAIKGKLIKINNRKVAHRLHSPDGTMEPTSLIIKEAEKYLGVKYVLGGKSKKGIDCSGLAQMAYRNSLGIILPRHSWGQKMIGRKVKLENIKSGDLIFLIKKENGHRHVGIAEVALALALENNPSRQTVRKLKNQNFVISSLGEKSVVSDISKNLDFSRELEMTVLRQSKVNLIHASSNKEKVVRQNLAEVLKSYDFVEARRIINS